MSRKMIDLPYVGRMWNLDRTGFISRLWKVVCYSNCRLSDYSVDFSLTQYTIPTNSLSSPK